MRHILLLALVLAGCTSNLDVTTSGGGPLPASSAMTITSRRPVVARAGDTVELAGTGFKPTMKLAMVSGGNLGLTDTRDLKVNVASESRASFQVPPDVGSGVSQLAASQDGQAQTISLVFATEATTDQPIFTGEAAEICDGRKFYDANGDMKTGSKPCVAEDSKAKTVAECTIDGETDCIATLAFTAAATEGLAAKIVEGSTVAGIEGSAIGATADCSEGQINCVVREPLAAINPALLSPDNIRSGVSIAGVAGAVVPAPAFCAADGAASCVVDGTAYKAAALASATPSNIRAGATVAGVSGSVTPAPANCSSDGATGCVAVAAYKAANMTDVTAANIKSGVTIAGVAGDFPSATNKLTGASGTTDLMSLAASTAAGSYEWWGPDGGRYTGSIADAGTVTPTTSNQTFNTSVYRQFVVSGDANLIAGKIKSGVSLFGVTGDYPSASYPLPGADSTADLDFATFDAQIKSSTSFEWFDPSGTRYTNTGDTDITAANISNGVTIFGSTGTVVAGAGSNCTSDGQTDCLTTASYPSAQLSNISTWDLRVGKSFGGVTGALKTSCRNRLNTTVYAKAWAPDNTAGTGGPLSWWNTIDDENSNDVYPTSLATDSSWTAATDCDHSNWQDVTSGGCTSAAADCMMKDLITGLTWSESYPVTGVAAASTTENWSAALSRCYSLVYGGQSDWRLPTQKELMEAYVHGIRSVGYNGTGVQNASGTTDNNNFFIANIDDWFWSASSRSSITTRAWYVNLSAGFTYYDFVTKTSAGEVLCVRP